MRSALPAVTVCVLLAGPATAAAQEVRYYEEDGVTYREVKRTVHRPVAETVLEERRRTIFRERVSVELQETERTCLVPVTEYRRVAYWQGCYNPFVQPYLEERLVPSTRWETRTEVVKLPIARRQWVPETSIVRVPITTHRLVQQEVTSRVAVAGRRLGDPFAAIAAAPPAQGVAIGGIAKLDGDPPRRGSALAGAGLAPGPGAGITRARGGGSQWRPAAKTPHP